VEFTANLRRNVFKVFARALRSPKLAGFVRRHALRVDPQSIVESDVAFMDAFEKRWEQDDRAV
jgi:hypothetical protein